LYSVEDTSNSCVFDRIEGKIEGKISRVQGVQSASPVLYAPAIPGLREVNLE